MASRLLTSKQRSRAWHAPAQLGSVCHRPKKNGIRLGSCLKKSCCCAVCKVQVPPEAWAAIAAPCSPVFFLPPSLLPGRWLGSQAVWASCLVLIPASTRSFWSLWEGLKEKKRFCVLQQHTVTKRCYTQTGFVHPSLLMFWVNPNSCCMKDVFQDPPRSAVAQKCEVLEMQNLAGFSLFACKEPGTRCQSCAKSSSCALQPLHAVPCWRRGAVRNRADVFWLDLFKVVDWRGHGCSGAGLWPWSTFL